MFTRVRKELTEFNLSRIRHWIFLGIGFLFLGLFLRLGHEIFFDSAEAQKIQSMDESLLGLIESHRTGWLTARAVDVTALGSSTVITLIVIVFLFVLCMLRDFLSIFQLICATLGSAALTLIFKNLLERPRPIVVEKLVEVSGYSFPSGHSLSSASLYITFVMMAGRYFKVWWEHLVLHVLAFVVISLVGLSRIYLGVHYPSDVLSGICVGSAWAFFTAAIVAVIARRQIKNDHQV